ncbi:MAG TPA: hypothetical protein VE913_09215 [Longimicrobium sp.]|nr:hypothetical protein [Longimicrobium sp.]
MSELVPTPRRSPAKPRHNGSPRWLLPAVIARDFRDPSERWRILVEVPGDLGVALWQTMRDTEMWTGAASRDELFPPEAIERQRTLLDAAAPPPELAAALEVLMGILRYPAEVHPELVSMACGRVSRWAEAIGAIGTALAFAEEASVAAPSRGRPALEAGRLAALRGEPDRAEAWLRRAVAVCRSDEGHESRNAGRTCAAAWAELGDLYAAQGDEARARRAYGKAAWAARRFGAEEALGRALWGMGRLELSAGHYANAEHTLRSAARSRGALHAEYPAIVHALAEACLRQGNAEDAAPALRELLPLRPAPMDELRTRALLCLAAAHADADAPADEDWARAHSLSASLPPCEEHIVALLDLAHAAARSDQRRREAELAWRAARMAALIRAPHPASHQRIH